jgi:hypothetical protein
MGKKKAKRDALAGVVLITAEPDGSFGFEIESDLSADVLAEVLKGAVAQITGTVDRAAGAWGR